MMWTEAGRTTSDQYTIMHYRELKQERGICFTIDQPTANIVKGYWAVSDTVTMVKLSTKPVESNIIQHNYAPTASST